MKLEVFDEDSVGKADLVGTAELKVPTDRLDSEVWEVVVCLLCHWSAKCHFLKPTATHRRMD